MDESQGNGALDDAGIMRQFIRAVQLERDRTLGGAVVTPQGFRLAAHRYQLFVMPGEPIVYVGIRRADDTDWTVIPYDIGVVLGAPVNMLANLTGAVAAAQAAAQAQQQGHRRGRGQVA